MFIGKARRGARLDSYNLAKSPRQLNRFRHNWHMECKRRGFTLIELLIVMAIIGALMAIVTVSANTIYAHSRATAALAHVVTLQKAQTQFYAINRRFAPFAQLLRDHVRAPRTPIELLFRVSAGSITCRQCSMRAA